MAIVRLVAFAMLLIGLVGCSSSSKFKAYRGPEVTHVLVMKDDRKLYLFHHDKVLKKYPVDLGFTAEGHKQFEGDGKTPEGRYYIDRRNPNSAFHLSLGISYPNAADIAFAQAHGKSPGGDIFIHGQPNGERRVGRPDWTAGCISLKNRQMEEIYAMVRNGTPVTIKP